MEKDRDSMSNGSYLYKLNEELSGQAELTPYFVTSDMGSEQDAMTQSDGEADLNLSQSEQDDSDR